MFRVSEALGELIPERYDICDWLFDAASSGSWIALELLVEVSPHKEKKHPYSRYLRQYYPMPRIWAATVPTGIDSGVLCWMDGGRDG